MSLHDRQTETQAFLLLASRSPARLGANANGVNASLYLGDRLSAGLLAGPAGLGADPAMRMHLAMATAFLGAGRTGTGAGLDDLLQNFGILPGAPDRSPPGGKADIGAVLVQPDALAKLRHHVFGKAGIGTGDAGLGASKARLDAGDQRIIGGALHLRMGLDHGSDGHGAGFLSAIGHAGETDNGPRCSLPDPGMRDPGAVKKTFR